MKLIRFLMKLCNQSVMVQLKNGDEIRGTLTNVDISMNTFMRAVKVVSKEKSKIYNLETITIRGKNIRYYVLPNDLPLDALLQDDTPKTKDKKKEAAKSGGRGKGRGPRRRGRGRARGRGRC